MERPPEQDDDGHSTELAQQLIEGGSEIAGSVGGAALGLLVAGLPGALGGAASGPVVTRVLKRVGADFRRRWLGPREQVRVGAAYAFAAQAIWERQSAGEEPRQDGFFEDPRQRSSGEELLEGVLVRARDAYEERKVRHLGHLYAFVAFHPEISAAQANHLLSLAERLTYRQLVLLAVFEEHRGGLRDGDYRGGSAGGSFFTNPLVALLTEVHDLYRLGLLGFDREDTMLGVTDVDPRHLQPVGSGFVLLEAMGLRTIPIADRRGVIVLLS